MDVLANARASGCSLCCAIVCFPQDGMDVLANARASGCSLCCAIVKQHQQKLLEDTVKSTDTRSLYTITPCKLSHFGIVNVFMHLTFLSSLCYVFMAMTSCVHTKWKRLRGFCASSERHMLI